ncbi:hypothetical protein N8I77_011013 [Diaporthe amygdali]|uniref:NAD-dependent epimerase/dehydratase domain-containing protein n=1 Tax=Phomopsis amygdali TaxID=1214568 RepID=A0AAD9S7I2_PHOAM|nr:hypothetical protein N8I77_011013 [Diaporthe amygdali]
MSASRAPLFDKTRALGETARPRRPRVIVTGGSGKLGRAVVGLLSESWEVISLDIRRPPMASEDGKSGLGGAYRLVEVDLEDMGAVMETFISTDMAYGSVGGPAIDAVVHLAALPSPGQTNSSRQFRTNTMSTYNVLEAARKLGVRNIVLASSETLIGIPLAEDGCGHEPSSLPITEEHERRPESAYSLSKLVGEVLAEQYVRWDPELKIVSLRFSNVMSPVDYADFEEWQDDPAKRSWNAWGYIDARDGAQAVAKSLEASKTGHHQYLIAASDTCMRMKNEELVKASFPNIKYTPTSGPRDSLLSIDKAKKELGYDPKFTWEGQVKKPAGAGTAIGDHVA